MSFWNEIDAQLDRIETEKPQTFAAVRDILLDPTYGDIVSDVNANGVRAFGESSAFFAGSGGDRTLRSALRTAGWSSVWTEASYHYGMRSTTGEALTYIEGDVERSTITALCGACGGPMHNPTWGCVRPQAEELSA